VFWSEENYGDENEDMVSQGKTCATYDVRTIGAEVVKQELRNCITLSR
jgi:hypothetical protein